MVATVLPYVLNGYMSIEARMTSTGEEKMTKHTVGIDISKAWLDAFAAPEGRASRFSNDPTGFRKLIAWIGSEIDRIAYEPTGPFHRDFEDTLLKAGLPLYPINPFQVRSFARSLGGRAKTDAVDARMPATMAAAIERQLKRVDAEIQQRLQAEETLERRAVILTSIPGISDITAAGLIVHMPELGTLTGARAASLAGLAPVTRESGSWKGRSFIQGGGTKCADCSTCPRWSRSGTIPISSGSTRLSWPTGNRARSPLRR